MRDMIVSIAVVLSVWTAMIFLIAFAGESQSEWLLCNALDICFWENEKMSKDPFALVISGPRGMVRPSASSS